MRGLVVLVLLAGCVEESLVPCGDLACPQGYSCVTDRCVSAGQLAACAGLADGAACTIDHTGGTCDRGACIAEICGNGVLDPGEVCDDGNRNSGDGCSGTCTSLETCGNGIVDVAVGEGCDCGDAAHPSTLCAHPNSSDPSAECSADCKPRYCGDGMVNTIEQCDGSVPDTVTCSNYGYYRGTVTCQACQFSVQQCNGRCGDGTIDTANGEYCDQSVPTDGSCVAFGYDEGPLACGVSCGADLSGCHSLTWEHVGTPLSPVVDLTTGAGRLALVYSTGDAYVIDGANWIKAPDTYANVTGTASAVWAVGGDHIAKWTPAAGWQVITPPYTGASIDSIWASDALGLYISHTDLVPLDHYDGTWTTVDGSWAAGSHLLRTRTTLWLRPDFQNVYTFDGTTWSTISFGFIDQAAEDDQGRIWCRTDQGMLRGAPGAWEVVNAPATSGLAPGLGTMLIVDIEGAAGHHYDDLWAIGQPPLHVTGVPQSTGLPLLGAVGSTIYAGGFDGLYQLARGMWVQNGVDNNPVTALDGGPAVQMYGGDSYGGTALVLNDIDTFDQVALPMGDCDAAGVTSAGTMLASCGVIHGDGTVSFDPGGGLFEDGTLVLPDVDAVALWAAADNSAAAAAGPGMFSWRVNGTWQTMAVQHAFTSLRGDRLDRLYAIDNVDNGLYQFDGTTWQLVAADASEPLVVTPTRVYARSSTGVFMVIRATNAIAPTPFPPNATWVAGTGGEEVFVMARPLPRGSGLWHYDGTTLWPVQLPPNLNGVASLLGVGRNLLMIPIDNTGNYAPLWWLERTSQW